MVFADCQAPLPMGSSRQEYWSGLLFPPPGDLLDPQGLNHISYVSCAGRQSLCHYYAVLNSTIYYSIQLCSFTMYCQAHADETVGSKGGEFHFLN